MQYAVPLTWLNSADDGWQQTIMPGGRERLTYIETNILRLAPLGIYETI